ESLADGASIAEVARRHDLNANQLKSRIREAFAGESEHQAIRLSLVTFGFKNGLPLDADLVFDLRFLPNPYWDEDLRPLSGLDVQISDWVLAHDEAMAFIDAVAALIKQLLPGYLREGKSYLTVALGCTGGRHRSVSIAEKLMTTLAELGASASVFHRDIDRP
ncbi:MAG: RNase adapter RapZ, partial [Actinomycetota bacterium]